MTRGGRGRGRREEERKGGLTEWRSLREDEKVLKLQESNERRHTNSHEDHRSHQHEFYEEGSLHAGDGVLGS
jgi:hypothetical protein